MTYQPRVYLTGASCSGVSTLGRVLSRRFGVPQLDVDDFYWMPTDPPYSIKRPPEERVRLIKVRQSETEGWILTGSFIGWGEPLIQKVDLIVFLQTPTIIRLQRLDQRAAARYGARILPGGDMHEAHLAFRDWASCYDDPLFTGRNLAQHESWLSNQSAPVLRLQGQQSTAELMHRVAEELLRLSPCGA
ncbi:ATP-binding protein [Agrobacterium tumefaciens]|uniref:Adenylate kinase family enzyme n=1 Tax=Agrobacterium tumefaciens TaxID=358 RepID=A0AAW8M0Z3_AGRTU|nr:adenylate kinase [Agrobacterium tumefaciens]MBP2542232.1 adenylate kinase family enzyme [Agrobacterium tumefaciens]MBP2568060.1 adenylate kinase family enzyme [Agrobacterium tumefaciens]MDP9874168.1 adenylate kinase family enzyme [Agrobacterium tumefaciens]MDP9978764.1 adenylate kinase family enzyme [Agrobacterium tumefaciens]MDR6704843.1 adenylate kinase family enzyme [Agrobacterium tumefaciens]